MFEVKEILVSLDGTTQIKSWLAIGVSMSRQLGVNALRLERPNMKRGTLVPIEYYDYDFEYYIKSYEVLVYRYPSGKLLKRYSNIKEVKC